ncbi:hypothetical protein GL305_33425 [Nocardia seriolae]|uniref:Excalibur calcium-binding domain-containing protein n=1 Tax=Nocardia seriolae TaxID=37332 RepID=A0A0B8NM28_9NOCA|nr:excalibur calcium-binding domain-containing protein [Nocardia seriolae]GEM26930.1 hypothetical protein NS2_51690 [Nocardia seriolae NBRC 15557]APB01365.1 hypothetical protein NS506_07345 [Nocardia seriolae]MTJ61141.1 hypothetical protein [Nocardia seriolae]MTJ74410.1 hypothetical protein [Nocardia seriolae]MTJ90733.1 hypothetical protein [Nocardia seriolae]
MVKHRNDFRGRAALAAGFGAVAVLLSVGAVAQASPGENQQPSNPSGSYSLSRDDSAKPSAHPKAKPDPIYSSCEQVWEQGKGPIYQGQPGYSSYLDPNGTGVACNR